MKEKTIRTLIIGGAGFIGAHIVPLLIATGRHVTVLGRGKIPRYALPEGVVYVAGDFAQTVLINHLLDINDEVIHLAYATIPNTSFDNPLVDLLQNLPPTVQLFSAVALRNLKLVLVSSGGTVYGEANELPMLETHSTKPISPYGVTKLTLENYAYLYAATHGLKFVCVRPANAYGVGQQPFVGQGFVATAMAAAIQGIPIQIFGERGTIRDYLYVTDLAAGIVSALLHGRLSEVYNLSSGVGLSNLEVIEAFRPLLPDSSIQIKHQPERAFDVKANVLDASKLISDTGWCKKVSFDEGLRKTRDWLRGACV